MAHPAIFSMLLALLGAGIPATSVAPSASFEQQLAIFQGLGFTLKAGVTEADILRWNGGREAFEAEPFKLLYITLGQTIEREPWTPLTDRCWDFDTEAIEGDGAYVRIMTELSRISRGEVLFTELTDHVDHDLGKAWVEFTFHGKHEHWDFAAEDDWVDPTLFTRLAALVNKHNTEGHYTYFDTGGQDAVIGYETDEGREKLRAMTGLAIEWIK